MTNITTPSTSLTGIDAVFPGDVSSLMPRYEDIPDEFKNWNLPSFWNKVQSQWFFSGLKDANFLKPKEGISKAQAMLHLSCVQRSWQSDHNHKSASVAYLMSLWFELPSQEEQEAVLKDA